VDSSADTKNVRQVSEVKSKQFEVRTYVNTDTKKSRWGYDIYVDSKLYVHQPHIPAVSGREGFITEEEAKKVGNFVVKKMKRNIVPPTVSVEELDSMKIE